MKHERTLAFQLAKKISISELEAISGAGEWTQQWTANATHTPAGFDGQIDATWDF